MKKIICSGLIEKDGNYLLVKAKVGAPKGLWNNPGGHKDEESIENAIKREVKEETGFDVEIGKLIGTYIFGETKKYVYETKIVGGKLECPPDEIEKARWFTVDEVKKLKDITFGALQSVIDYSNKKFNQTYTIDRIP
jgi:8-oxo-dGTP pyrophosphatase MutT (NUDIX family)